MVNATLRPMSHLQFSRAILSSEFSRATKLQVWHGESREFLTVAQQLFPNRALLYSVQLCWQNAERWLVSCHRFFVSLLFAVHIRLFCLIYFNLFNLFNLEIARSYANTLQFIEFYEKRPYLSHVYATKSQCAILSRDFVAHSRDKIARENCRCDIGLTLLPLLDSSALYCTWLPQSSKRQ